MIGTVVRDLVLARFGDDAATAAARMLEACDALAFRADGPIDLDELGAMIDAAIEARRAGSNVTRAARGASRHRGIVRCVVLSLAIGAALEVATTPATAMAAE